MIWILVIPIIVYLVMDDRAAKTLDSMNEWQARIQRWVKFAVFLLIDFILLSSGLTKVGVIST